MTPILAFDIETVPDCAGIRRLHDLPADLSDRDVAEVGVQKRRAQSGGAATSCRAPAARGRDLLRAARTTRACASGRSASPTPARPRAIQRFFDGIEQVHAAARVLERARLRPAGAALPRPDPRRRRRVLLGHRRRRTEFSSTTTSTASTTRHFDLMDVLAHLRRARRAARRDGAASRASRASSAWTAARCGRAISRGGIEAIRRLLRDRRAQHLSPVPALPAHALQLHPRALRSPSSRCVRSTLEKRAEPHWREFLSLWK